MACDAFFVTVFRQKSPFSTVQTKNEAFSNVSTFEIVLESLRFQRPFRAFCVDDRRTHKKVCVFKRKRITVDVALGKLKPAAPQIL